MNLLFDLDGTLVQSHTRLYRLFQHLVPSSGLSYDAYWQCKRQMQGHPVILKDQFNYNREQITAFEQAWMSLIEQPEWIRHDQPFEGVTDMLQMLSARHRLYVITARQSEATALQQLKGYGWEGLFTNVFVTGGKREKSELIRGVLHTTPEDWLIGDTGVDIQTGKKLNVRTAAVLSGFRDKEALLPYQPDAIIDNVLDFPALLQANALQIS